MFNQFIQGIADHDHHIGVFATGQTVGNRFGRLAHGRAKDGVEGVPALLGVLRAEQFIRGGEAARGHDLELFGVGGQRQGAEDDSGEGLEQRLHCAASCMTWPRVLARRYNARVEHKAHSAAKIIQYAGEALSSVM